MELKPDSAKIADMATSFDAMPVETGMGPVLWATVRIEYVLAGLGPTVAIRVPIPFEPAETEAQRRTQALRNARLLIDHACRASGIGMGEPAPGAVESLVEGMAPPSMEGISQELGLAAPKTRPR